MAPVGGTNPGMGNNLKSLREERDWTHEEVAARFGMSRSGFIKLERGERKLSEAHIAKATEVFGVSSAEVLGESATTIPIIAWVSAGDMLRDDVADEALGAVRVNDLPPGDWIALRVVGDSMDRISPPESTIFVDRKDRQLVPNALYVIADEDGRATYKRYRPGPPMRFEPVSVNSTHEAIFPENEPLIVGRVKRSVLDAM